MGSLSKTAATGTAVESLSDPDANEGPSMDLLSPDMVVVAAAVAGAVVVLVAAGADVVLLAVDSWYCCRC